MVSKFTIKAKHRAKRHWKAPKTRTVYHDSLLVLKKKTATLLLIYCYKRVSVVGAVNLSILSCELKHCFYVATLSTHLFRFSRSFSEAPLTPTRPSNCQPSQRNSTHFTVSELWTNRTPHIYKCTRTHTHTHAHTHGSWVIGEEECLSERWMDETMKINEVCVCLGV